MAAGAIQERLGVEQANLSQHLAILKSRQLVLHRKEGNQVFYSLKNPVLAKILDIVREYFMANLNEAVRVLGEISAEGEREAHYGQEKLPLEGKAGRQKE